MRVIKCLLLSSSYSIHDNHAYSDCIGNTNADDYTTSNTAIWHPDTASNTKTSPDSAIPPNAAASADTAVKVRSNCWLVIAATFTIAAIAFRLHSGASLVTFESPCSCRDNHGLHRWSVKNDPSLPPVGADAIQAVTPSDIYSWPGPDVPLTQSSERTGIENNCYALTGRVVALKVEADGDLHIALQDATGDKPGIVVCEVPANRSGVQFVKRFLVGRGRDSLSTLALLGS